MPAAMCVMSAGSAPASCSARTMRSPMISAWPRVVSLSARPSTSPVAGSTTATDEPREESIARIIGSRLGPVRLRCARRVVRDDDPARGVEVEVLGVLVALADGAFDLDVPPLIGDERHGLAAPLDDRDRRLEVEIEILELGRIRQAVRVGVHEGRAARER